MSDTVAPETGTTTTPVVTTDQLPGGQPETGDTTDWKAEASKWKSLARKNEQQATSNLTELQKLQQASMSDQEKAVAVAVEAARGEARTETLRSVGSRLVDAEVKAAASGRSVDVEALLEGLDRSRFLDDDGEPKVKEIVAWVDRIAPVGPEKHNFPDLGQGARGISTALSPGDDALLKAVVDKVGARRR